MELTNKHMNTFDKFAIGVFLSAIMMLTVIGGMAILQDHSIKKYYISRGIDRDILSIKGYVNWGFDPTIALDRQISWREAIDLVTRLNKTIN